MSEKKTKKIKETTSKNVKVVKKETIKVEKKVEKIEKKVDTGKFKNLINEIEKMNLKDLNDFVKMVQEYFDVIPMMATSNSGDSSSNNSEANTKVSVLLTATGQSKIAVIKVIGSLTGKGLMDSKKMLESLPVTIVKDKTQEEAEAIKKQLVDVGASIEIK